MADGRQTDEKIKRELRRGALMRAARRLRLQRPPFAARPPRRTIDPLPGCRSKRLTSPAISDKMSTMRKAARPDGTEGWQSGRWRQS